MHQSFQNTDKMPDIFHFQVHIDSSTKTFFHIIQKIQNVALILKVLEQQILNYKNEQDLHSFASFSLRIKQMAYKKTEIMESGT